jgi:uncharacterized protein YndB with AHSA1/START domain
MSSLGEGNMSVKKDVTGRRYIQVEVEVPGTPEEVWQAIATGPGITSWFVPTELEERVGGSTVSHFGPEPSMDSRATITAWEPPHRFAAEGVEPMGEGASPLATEWIVEARSGGTCVVRVVHSLFTNKEDWDGLLESIESGWPAFFRILRRYLSEFRGQPSATIQLMGAAAEPKEAAWRAFTSSLSFAGARAGDRVSAAAGVPQLGGVVERAGEPGWPEELLLELDAPAPGTAHLYAQPMGGQIYLTTRIFLYGDEAARAAAQTEPQWQAWMGEHFPMPDGVS